MNLKIFFFLIVGIVFANCNSPFKETSDRNLLIDKKNKIKEIIKKPTLNARKILDSLSKNITLPYGYEGVETISFPKHWYCGDGYIEGSLKKNNYPIKDSIKYAKDYFSILKFYGKNLIDHNKKTNSSILKNSIPLLSINSTQENNENSFFYPYIKLPKINNYSVYGITFRKDDYTYNPLFILLDDNNNITDYLTSFEYTRPSQITTKVIYIDENYIFNIVSFDNIDGFEVETGIKEKYTIFKGKFVKFYEKNGYLNKKNEQGLVENNTKEGKWNEFTYEDGKNKPIYFLESSYRLGVKNGMFKYYNLTENLEKGMLFYTDTYENGKMVKREFVKD